MFMCRGELRAQMRACTICNSNEETVGDLFSNCNLWYRLLSKKKWSSGVLSLRGHVDEHKLHNERCNIFAIFTDRPSITTLIGTMSNFF